MITYQWDDTKQESIPMTEREDVVDAVARAIGPMIVRALSPDNHGDANVSVKELAQAAITAAKPFVERALLQRMHDLTVLHKQPWGIIDFKLFASDLGYDIGE